MNSRGMNRNLLASLLSVAALVAGCETARPAGDGGQAASDASPSSDATTPPLPDAGPAPLDASVDAGEIDPDAGDPPACGAHGQACCAGTCGHSALTCVGGLCQGACGSAGDPCCAGFHCSGLQTECDAASRTCVAVTVLEPYALCDDSAPEVACPLATVCVPSRLDTRLSPASFCTADCTDGIPCPGTPLGPMGVCVIAGGGGQCHLPCGGTTECPSDFACRTAPGDLGDYWVCVPSDP